MRLDTVQRVVRAAAVTPLPEAPEIVLGILNLQGQVIPVINMRKRFRLAERGVRSEDQFVVARSGNLTVALAVDGTESVIEHTEVTLTAPDDIVSGLSYLEGVTTTEQGLLMIHDLETLLFKAEEEAIAQALEKARP